MTVEVKLYVSMPGTEPWFFHLQLVNFAEWGVPAYFVVYNIYFWNEMWKDQTITQENTKLIVFDHVE